MNIYHSSTHSYFYGYMVSIISFDTNCVLSHSSHCPTTGIYYLLQHVIKIEFLHNVALKDLFLCLCQTSSCSSQCSPTGVTKAVVRVILSITMIHIKEPLLLIRKSSLCGGSRFPVLISEWSLYHMSDCHITVNKTC